MMYNTFSSNFGGTAGFSCVPADHYAPDSREMEQLLRCIVRERVVEAIPLRWIWDAEAEFDHPSDLLVKAVLPDGETTFLCTVPGEEMDRGGFRTPDNILFKIRIRVVLGMNEEGALVASRKRAQEITAAYMADQDNADEAYEATILCRRPGGYTVLVNDYHAHLRDSDIHCEGGRAALVRQKGQTLPVRFSHVFDNGHMFVYSDEKYPRIEDMERGTLLPCTVLDLREDHVLTALSPRVAAVAYYPDSGSVEVGSTMICRVTHKVRNEDGSLYVRVKLFTDGRETRSA